VSSRTADGPAVALEPFWSDAIRNIRLPFPSTRRRFGDGTWPGRKSRPQRRSRIRDPHRKRIVLIDSEQLTQLMMDFGVGVTEVETYKVKKLDHDCFDEE
jgi:hypothetical protein